MLKYASVFTTVYRHDAKMCVCVCVEGGGGAGGGKGGLGEAGRGGVFVGVSCI